MNRLQLFKLWQEVEVVLYNSFGDYTLTARLIFSAYGISLNRDNPKLCCRNCKLRAETVTKRSAEFVKRQDSDPKLHGKRASTSPIVKYTLQNVPRYIRSSCRWLMQLPKETPRRPKKENCMQQEWLCPFYWKPATRQWVLVNWSHQLYYWKQALLEWQLTPTVSWWIAWSCSNFGKKLKWHFSSENTTASRKCLSKLASYCSSRTCSDREPEPSAILAFDKAL